MRELLEICPKIQFLKLFSFFLRSEGVEFAQKRCKIECSDVSGTTWKSPCLRPGKITIFLHYHFLNPVPLKNLALPPTSKLLF